MSWFFDRQDKSILESEVQTSRDARDQTARLIQEANAQAVQQRERVLADSRTLASEIVEEALTEAQRQTTQEQERLLAEARVQAREIIDEAQAVADNIQAVAVSRRASVTVLFHDELAAATDGFSDAHCVGRGGFGSVYKAVQTGPLIISGAESHLAVKKLDSSSIQGQTEFLQEVQILGGCRHENLLVLLGFSADKGQSVQDAGGVCLVTPLMKGGSLEDRLQLDIAALERLNMLSDVPPADGWAPLTWQERVRVLVGAVTGLVYLHTPDPGTHKPTILHCDIKPSNILLDIDLQPRLAGPTPAQPLSLFLVCFLDS